MEEEEAPVEQTLHKISLKRTAVSNLREHWNNRSLSDISVSLHVAGSPVCEHALHKMVLCSSAYFNSLIKGEWGLVDRGELRPDDPFFTVDAFEAVLRGLYGFEVDVSKGNVLNLLAVGSYLQVEEICEDCKTFLLGELDRMPLSDVAHCYATVSCREYPVSDEIKRKSHGLLAAHSWVEAQDVLLSLPPTVLTELLGSNSLWVPDEARRVELILELLDQLNEMNVGSMEGAIVGIAVATEHSETCTTVDPCTPDFEDPVNCSLTSSNRGGSSDENDDENNIASSVEIPSSECFSYWSHSDIGRPGLREALLQVLRTDIHYMFIPDNQLCALQRQLIMLGDEPTLDALRRHMWVRGIFYGHLIAVDSDVDGGNQPDDSLRKLWEDSWLRFGVEFKDVNLMEQKGQKDSNKIYYGGFLWWVKLRYRERDDSEDMYNAYICIGRCQAAAGSFVDQQGRGIVDVHALVNDKYLSLGDFRFNINRFAWGDGRGWAVFKKSNLQSFLTKAGTVRIAVALRLVT